MAEGGESIWRFHWELLGGMVNAFRAMSETWLFWPLSRGCDPSGDRSSPRGSSRISLGDRPARMGNRPHHLAAYLGVHAVELPGPPRAGSHNHPT